MTELPRVYAGETRVDRPVWAAGPLAPWHATVKVMAVRLQRRDTFNVVCEWTGPPALYMPADERPGLRQDIATIDDLQLARAVAILAAEQLGRGKVPDLRAAAERFRARASRNRE